MRADTKTTPSGAVASPRSEGIREAALTLFAERGYRATTMNDLARVVGIRAPSIYNYVDSKHQLLREIMVTTMDELIEGFHRAVADTEDAVECLERVTEAHLRYHMRHRREAFVGNREIWSLNTRARNLIIDKRKQYSMLFRELIERGQAQGVFRDQSSRLVAYAILDMGIGVSTWFRPDGEYSEDAIAGYYGEFALRLAGAQSH